MGLFFEAFISFLIAALVIVAIWMIYGKLVTPIKPGKGERLRALVYASGNAPGLGRTVKGLLWLINSGRIDMEIIIADGGLDSESRKMAELLERGYVDVKLCRASELGDVLARETEEECRKEISLR